VPNLAKVPKRHTINLRVHADDWWAWLRTTPTAALTNAALHYVKIETVQASPGHP